MMRRKCTRCRYGEEECIVGQFWLCDMCDSSFEEEKEAVVQFELDCEDTAPIYFRGMPLP